MNVLQNYEKYEQKLRESLIWDYALLIFVTIIVIGLILFAIWWYIGEKNDTKKSQRNIKEKIPVIISAIMLFLIIVGTADTLISGITKKTYDINNKAYVVVAEDFIVRQEDWWGRWNNDTYTIEYKKNGELMTIHPDLKNIDLSEGEHSNLIFVYSLKSEIILDVFKRGNGSVS